MSLRDSKKKLNPGVCRLESRDMLTVISPLAFGGSVKVPLAEIRSNIAPGSLVAGSIASRVLTPHGTANSAFRAKFNGPVGVGAGQYVDQAKQFLYTASGNTSQFLVGRLVMRLFIPSDPNGQIMGIGSIRNRNIGTTGTQLVFDFKGGLASTDQLGRPTHLDWTVNPNSSGYYIGATGQGTMAIIYSPTHRKVGSHSGHESGSATVIFAGTVLNNGNTVDLATLELNKRL